GYRRAILLAALGLTAVALWQTQGVGFNYNMLELQAKGVESVAWEERILKTAGRSGFAAITTAGSLDELRRKQAAFAALPSVSRVESILAALPDAQAAKTTLITELAPSLASIAVAPPPALEPAALRPPLETLRRRLRLALDEATGDQTVSDLRRLHGLVEGLLGRLAGAETAPLARLQDAVRADFADKLRVLRKSLEPRPALAEELPAELRQRYVGASGRFLLRVHPAVDIWQQAGAERFVRDLRSVDPDVTGPPITSFEAIRYIRQGYLEGTLYAFVLVAAVTALVLRSARGTALALTPLVLGVVWTLGVMRLFGLEFNLANVWALPLIIGTSAEYGLNIFVRFLESRAEGGPTLAHSAVMAVVVNGLTTIAGFGSLMVAHHRGIFSLGVLLTIGACAALLASLVVFPVLIELFGRARPVPAGGQLSTSDVA
ncbi:MAG TPA: MMPL family transporter, partial [Methylomirabilota bacterium]|nr:MMPL family transporter [Methylomirabilota bacterium]